MIILQACSGGRGGEEGGGEGEVREGGEEGRGGRKEGGGDGEVREGGGKGR